jgi:Skp family chaperone for outer membrane proteins
MTPSSDELVE